MTKILCIGDIHIKKDCIGLVTQTLDDLTRLATMKKDELVAIVVLGDVLDTKGNLNVLAMNLALRFFRTLADVAPVYVIVGNHDMVNERTGEDNWMTHSVPAPNIILVEEPGVYTIGNTTCVMTPYVPPGKFWDAIGDMVERNEPSVVFAHQEVVGADMEGRASKNGDPWPASRPLLVSGHIHTRQTILGGRVHYVGSVRPTSTNDRSKTKAVSLVDTVDMRIVDVGIPVHGTHHGRFEYVHGMDVPERGDTVLTRMSRPDFKVFESTEECAKFARGGVDVRNIPPVLSGVRVQSLSYTNDAFISAVKEGLVGNEADIALFHETLCKL